MMIELDNLKKVTINPSEVIVFTVDSILSDQQKTQLRDRLKSMFPNNECVVLDRNGRLDIYVRKDDVQANLEAAQRECEELRLQLNALASQIEKLLDNF